MKKILLTLITILAYTLSIAQSTCTPFEQQGQCNPLSITDPDPAIVQPPPGINNGFRSNSFDWTTHYYDMFKPNFGGQYSPNIIHNKSNPYWSSYLKAIAHNEESDMYPKDGWELVKQDLGFFQCDDANWESNTILGTDENVALAYILLYNKYQSKLRIFAALPAHFPSNYVDISLSFDHPKTNASALFNAYNTPMQSVNETSNTVEVHAPAATTDDAGLWFYADFQMAYDPCTCFFESPFSVHFQTVDNAHLTATGVAIGHAIGQYDYNTANTPQNYLYTDQYLWNYTNNPKNKIQNMMQDFNDASKISDVINQKYYDAATAASTLDALNKGFAFLGNAAQLYASVTTAGTANIATVADVADDTATRAGKALGVIGDAFDFFSTTADKPIYNTQPMLISMQMALDGNVQTAVDKFNFSLANPGSYNAWNKEEYAYLGTDKFAPSAPVYNNTMGLFAMIENPEYSLASQTTFTKSITSKNIGQSVEVDHQLETTDIKFEQILTKFNFIMNPLVDADKTSIQLAFETKVERNFNGTHKDTISILSPFSNAECIYGGLSNIYDIASYGTRDITVGCCQDDFLRNYLTQTVIGHNLVVSIAYIFKPDIYGTIHTSYQLLKYKMNNSLILGGFSGNASLQSIPTDLNLTTQTLAGNSSIYSNGTITINGNITTSNSYPTYIRAENSINVLPGSIIAPNIVLEINYKPCSSQKLKPMEIDEGFCKSKMYQSAISTSKTNPTTSVSSEIPTTSTIQLYPNPTTDNLTLATLASCSSPAQIRITDVTGKVLKIIETELQKGNNTLSVATQDLATGTYILTITNHKDLNISKPFVKM